MNRAEDGKRTMTSMLTNIVSVIIQMIVSLISVVLITKIISVDDLGIATSFITLKNIMTIICLLSITSSINRMLVDIKKDEFEYLSSIYIFSSVFCSIICLLYLLFNQYLSGILGFDLKMMLFMFSLIFLINGCSIVVTYWNYKNFYKYNFIYNILSNPVGQLLSLLFAYILVSNKYLGRIVGIDFFNIIFGLICGIVILVKGKFKFNINYVIESLKISVPMIPHLISQLLLTSCDLLMIKNLIGPGSAGIYGMAYTISTLLYAILIQFFNPWSPWVYRRLNNNQIETVYTNSSLMMSFSFYLCIGLICIAPDLIKLFLNSDYYDAISLIAPITVGIFFQIMYIFFFDVEYYYKKNKQISIYSVIACVLNIVLNYILISKYGYQAAAYTTLFSYFILLLLHYFGMRSVDKRKIYNVRHMASLSIILLSVLIILHIIHYYLVFRYIILILVTLIMFIIYRNKIIELLQKIRRNI